MCTSADTTKTIPTCGDTTSGSASSISSSPVSNLPNLSLVRVSHDHMGASPRRLGGVNTPETQQADDDLAVGRLVQSVSESPYAADTLIIVTEDDCQDGPDHVDSHRATTYFVGPYVKKGAVVSEHYSQVNALRTIEDILGTQHLNLNTAFQRPMTDVFDFGCAGRRGAMSPKLRRCWRTPRWRWRAVASG